MLHTCNLLPEKMILILQDDNFPLKLKTIILMCILKVQKINQVNIITRKITFNNNNNRKF